MKPPTPDHYTQTAFGQKYGFTYAQIQRYRKDRRLVLEGRWVRGDASIKLVQETQNPKGVTEDIFNSPSPYVATPPDDVFLPPDEDDTTQHPDYRLDFLIARARKEAALAEKAEIENRQRRGELVLKTNVVKMVAGRSRAFRDGLLLASQRVSPILATLTDVKEIQSHLDKEYRYLLQEWAKEPLI